MKHNSFNLFNKSEGDTLSIKPQLHPQLIILKAYMKIKRTWRKQTGIRDRMVKLFIKAQISSTRKFYVFINLKTLVTIDWICLHSVLDSTDGLFKNRFVTQPKGDILQIKTTHDYQTMIVRPWRFCFLLPVILQNEWLVKAGRLFETQNYRVVSTYIGM